MFFSFYVLFFVLCSCRTFGFLCLFFVWALACSFNTVLVLMFVNFFVLHSCQTFLVLKCFPLFKLSFVPFKQWGIFCFVLFFSHIFWFLCLFLCFDTFFWLILVGILFGAFLYAFILLFFFTLLLFHDLSVQHFFSPNMWYILNVLILVSWKSNQQMSSMLRNSVLKAFQEAPRVG